MAGQLRVSGARDGKEVKLPKGLDAIDIQTDIGVIHIDLGNQIPNMVLMRSSELEIGAPRCRLLISPMDSRRVAVGVVQA